MVVILVVHDDEVDEAELFDEAIDEIDEIEEVEVEVEIEGHEVGENR